MKVEINTKERSVYVQANDVTKDVAEIDRWLKALKTARDWLRKERETAS